MADNKKPDTKKGLASSGPMPWWAKIILGTAGIYLIATKTPILEILNLFFFIVMVPIGLMMSIGLISSGSVQAFSNGWGNMMTDVKEKIEKKASEKIGEHDKKKKKKAAKAA